MPGSFFTKVTGFNRNIGTWVAGVFVVASLVLVVYAPALKTGFLMNDWMFLRDAATTPLPQFLVQSFDPRAQTYGYRPLHNIRILANYWLFGAHAEPYHFVQITFHIINCLLLMTIVWRISMRRQVTLLAGILFATFPTYYMAVLWLSDPVTIPFFLLTIIFWIEHLQHRLAWAYVAALVGCVLALMTKEINVVLPGILLLVDRAVIGKSTTYAELARRYAPFVVLLPLYLCIESIIQAHGVFIPVAGWGFGSHILVNLQDYLSALTFPWFAWFPVGRPELDLPHHAWMFISVAFLILAIIMMRSRIITFLLLSAIIPIVPVLGFGLEWFDTRYLYYSSMAVAVLLALFFSFSVSKLASSRWWILVVSLLIGTFLVVDGLAIAGYTAKWAEVNRQRRVPFRDIERAHSTFEKDSYIYLLESPSGPTFDLATMLLLRYGRNLSVERLENEPAHLADHKFSYVYYFTETGRPVEVRTGKDVETYSSRPLPVQFANSIRLESYDLPRSSIPADEALVLLFTWTTSAKLDKDYTVFVHLIDPAGRVAASQDAQPRGGNAPTSRWVPGSPVADAVVIPIPKDIPTGDGYRLELGLYYLPTMERVAILDEAGAYAADSLVIQPLKITQ